MEKKNDYNLRLILKALCCNHDIEKIHNSYNNYRLAKQCNAENVQEHL